MKKFAFWALAAVLVAVALAITGCDDGRGREPRGVVIDSDLFFDEVATRYYGEAAWYGQSFATRLSMAISEPFSVRIFAEDGIEALSLTMDTDNEALEEILDEMGLVGTVDLVSPTAAQAEALGRTGILTGREVAGEKIVRIPLVEVFWQAALKIPGGIERFDIEVSVTSAGGIDKTERARLTLEDDMLRMWGYGFELGEPVTIEPYEAAGGKQILLAADALRGIESYTVEITSTSEMFMEGLDNMGLGSKFDLADPTDEQAAALGSLMIRPFGSDVKGAQGAGFDMGRFMPMFHGVMLLSGESDFEAEFKVTVVDAIGERMVGGAELIFTEE